MPDEDNVPSPKAAAAAPTAESSQVTAESSNLTEPSANVDMKKKNIFFTIFIYRFDLIDYNIQYNFRFYQVKGPPNTSRMSFTNACQFTHLIELKR